jgi:hypothetical protein
MRTFQQDIASITHLGGHLDRIGEKPGASTQVEVSAEFRRTREIGKRRGARLFVVYSGIIYFRGLVRSRKIPCPYPLLIPALANSSAASELSG